VHYKSRFFGPQININAGFSEYKKRQFLQSQASAKECLETGNPAVRKVGSFVPVFFFDVEIWDYGWIICKGETQNADKFSLFWSL
jgi:hypothetical protein